MTKPSSWFIPSTVLEARTSVSLGGPKYAQFEIEPGRRIHALVYGADPPLESRSPAGEYPSGQRTATVNRQAQPSQVRILPPPFRGSAGSPPRRGWLRFSSLFDGKRLPPRTRRPAKGPRVAMASAGPGNEGRLTTRTPHPRGPDRGLVVAAQAGTERSVKAAGLRAASRLLSPRPDRIPGAAVRLPARRLWPNRLARLPKHLCLGQLLELFQGVVLDLADPLAGDAEGLPDLLEGQRLHA